MDDGNAALTVAVGFGSSATRTLPKNRAGHSARPMAPGSRKPVSRATIPVVIQATHHSRIFEGKSTVPIRGNITVLAYLISRISAAWPGEIIVTTSDRAEDDALFAEASRCQTRCVRETRDDLVLRLWKAVEHEPCDYFIRVFGNYPLLDISAMAAMVESHLDLDVDYSYNDHHEGVPWGMGCEIISKRALQSLLKLDLTTEQKEIGTLYIRQHGSQFSINRWKSEYAAPDVKLAFETTADLNLLQDIIEHVCDPDAPSVLAYLGKHPLLALSNQGSPPKEVGMEKLYLHPDKIEAVRRTDATAPDLSYPISVELTLTNRCNIDCVFCSDLDLRNRENMAELDTETLFGLFEDLKAGGTQGIVIEGGGEPTIHRDFAAIVGRLRSVGLPAGLITNGTRALSAEELSSLEWIRVSIDASTPEEWAKLKGQDRFTRVLYNLRNYATHCRTVGVGYVVTNSNMSDIETFVLRIRQHGVSYVQFRPVVDTPDLAPDDAALRYLRRYESDTFAVLIEGMEDNLPKSNAGLPCRAHSLTTVITGEGNVYLCGRLNIHPWIKPIGNIRDTSFCDIWNGEERARHSRQVLDAGFCIEHCPQCRLTKVNRLLDRLDRTRTPHFI